MAKVRIYLTNLYFGEKYISSYFIVFIDKKPKMSPFANNKYIFIVLTNKLIDNII